MGERGRDAGEQNALTVVIPSYERVGKLDATLASYYAQEGVAEIVIVDDASTQDYVTLVENHTARARERGVEIRLVRHATNLGAPVARERGIAEARHGFILMGEDDVRLAPDFVPRMFRHLKDTDVALVGARIVNVREGETDTAALARADAHHLADPVDYRWFVGNYESHCPSARDVPFVQAIGIWRRAVFDDVTHYADYGGNGYREETDPQIQLLALGRRIVYEPDAVAFHLPHTDKGGQRKVSRASAYYWTLRNNRVFLKRHYATLRSHGFAPYPRWFMNAFLAIKIIPDMLR